VLVDSLGYVDYDYDNPAVQDRVHALIEEEMLSGNVAPPQLPPAPELKLSPMVQAELARLERGEALAPIENDPGEAVQLSDADADDVGALEGRIDVAKTELEAQSLRQQNLQSLALSGAAEWLAFTKRNEAVNGVLQKELEAAAGSLEKVNQERKFAQEQAAGRLVGLDQKRFALSQKNLQLEMANAMLRRDIATLTKEAVRRGAKVPDMPSEVVREMMGTGAGPDDGDDKMEE